MRRVESDIPRSALSSIQKGTLNYRYKGVPCWKNPFDLALYQQLLWKLKPRTIVEVGSAHGGSALWYADMLKSYSIDGHIYSVDINQVKGIENEDITFLKGDAMRLNEMLTADLMNTIPRPLLVIEDAAHTFEMTSAVLEYFHPYLQPGEYIVVEDGIVNDMVEPVYQVYENGPNRAIFSFLESTSGFYEIDTSYCDFYGHNFTYCTNGYLRRLR